MLAMIVLQTGVATGGQPLPIDFDLRPRVVGDACAAGRPATDEDEVLVCGRRDAASRYRLVPLDTSRFESDLRAEATIVGDLKGAAELDRQELAPGLVSNRVMLRLKLPF